MNHSYRIWSAVMGAWYLVAVSSLIFNPPGATSHVKTQHGVTVRVPRHQTFYQIALGSSFWIAVFGLLGVALILLAVVQWRRLITAHVLGLVLSYSFGVGLLISNIQLHTGYLNAAFVLTTATAHVLCIQLGKIMKIGDEPRG